MEQKSRMPKEAFVNFTVAVHKASAVSLQQLGSSHSASDSLETRCRDMFSDCRAALHALALLLQQGSLQRCDVCLERQTLGSCRACRNAVYFRSVSRTYTLRWDEVAVAFFECSKNPAAGDTLAKYRDVLCGSDTHNEAPMAGRCRDCQRRGTVFFVV